MGNSVGADVLVGFEGLLEGFEVGCDVGFVDGYFEVTMGNSVGSLVWFPVGEETGTRDGLFVGALVGV